MLDTFYLHLVCETHSLANKKIIFISNFDIFKTLVLSSHFCTALQTCLFSNKVVKAELQIFDNVPRATLNFATLQDYKAQTTTKR